ncbi:hypothetical protein ACFXK0_05790 [Nocardia sp. NPDC059177]|uniref:hypothetical protein n=1 Tax=Nocardia sp. NPDC059177 TaxID=3346759 RepID=UPI0036B1567B
MFVVVGCLGVVAGLFWLRLVVMVLVSRLLTDPLTDPHGYALIFGTVFAMPAAALTVAALPLLFPPARRAIVGKVTALVVFAGTAATIIALLSGS